jgi:hypothetical protein
MKRALISLLVLCAFGAGALQMVNNATLQLETVPNPLGPWNSPESSVALQYGYLNPIYPIAVSNGYVRYYLNPAWTNNGDGTASMMYYDLSNSQIASNQAAADLAAAIASTNAIIAAAIAWTNAMTNSWATYTNAAHTFKALGAKYLPGWPTNTSWTYASAMTAFQNMPAGSQTITQLWDNVFWQRSYNQLTPFLATYCPSINTNDASDYNLKKYPWLWDWPGVK